MKEQDEQSKDDLGLEIDDNKLFAAMAYLSVLVFVPMFMRKQDAFVRFHIKQGLVLLLGFIITIILATWIPVVGNFLFVVLLSVNTIALILTLQGRSWRIPLVSNLADKFNF